jgi:hypothetical protein
MSAVLEPRAPNCPQIQGQVFLSTIILFLLKVILKMISNKKQKKRK